MDHMISYEYLPNYPEEPETMEEKIKNAKELAKKLGRYILIQPTNPSSFVLEGINDHQVVTSYPITIINPDGEIWNELGGPRAQETAETLKISLDAIDYEDAKKLEERRKREDQLRELAVEKERRRQIES